jgi:hypothetical protein
MAKRKQYKKEQNELALHNLGFELEARTIHCVARIIYEPIWTEDKAK